MKLFKLLFLFVLIAVLLAACAPTAQGLVELPDEGRLLALTLVTSGLTFVLLWLGGLLKIDFGGFIQPLAAVLSPLIITVIENYLAMIPPIYDNLVLSVIHIIVLLLGSVGSVVLFRRVKTRDTKALLV